MKYDEFITHVQSFAQLESREAAERASRATLEALKERIAASDANKLAAQLPLEIGQYLQRQEQEVGQHFSIEEFYRRVSEKEGVEPTIGAMHARAVFAVLEEAATPGKLTDIRANLSEEYEELFPAQKWMTGL
ncbi:DUF2267 domain-containing protein [Chroococcidiopsis sp.]|uniref:DUF2267 domain-containing protein n=1 Tax=Chroococcidiopsis sp. TaxID=3088168 RepID=UPI003F3D535D